MPVAVIVGAGPAGCVAAASFAKRGWHVHVYERGEGPEWALADSSRVYPLMLCSRFVSNQQSSISMLCGSCESMHSRVHVTSGLGGMHMLNPPSFRHCMQAT